MRALRRRGGFTLLEILIALSLTGMVTILALAPVTAAVRRVVEIQNTYADDVALSRTASFIGRDVAGALRLAQHPVVVEDHHTLQGDEDDVLIVMGTSQTRQQMPAGSIVYKLERGGPMRRVIGGLYRWLMPGKLPEQVDARELRGEEGQLILPGVTAFSVEIPKGDERLKTYSGELPTGICIALRRGAERDGEKFEDVVVFP